MNIFRIKRKSRKIKLKRYLLLLFSLIMTTFAWFTYSKLLDTELNLHLISWDIKFFVGGQEKTSPLDIVIQELYPGMEDKTVDVIVQNNGQATASLGYYISEISILGDTYNVVSDPTVKLGEDDIYIEDPIVGEDTSSQKIINDSRFPFTLDISYSNEVASGNEGYLQIKISWPGNNDELDTKFGYEVAKYYDSEVTIPQPLRILLEVNAIQKEE